MKAIRIAAQVALYSVRGQPRMKYAEPSYFRPADTAHDDITPIDITPTVPEVGQLVQIDDAIQAWGLHRGAPSGARERADTSTLNIWNPDQKSPAGGAQGTGTIGARRATRDHGSAAFGMKPVRSFANRDRVK